jgi:hypothetical protein
MAYGFVLGMGALPAFIGFYWFVIGPAKIMAEKHQH